MSYLSSNCPRCHKKIDFDSKMDKGICPYCACTFRLEALGNITPLDKPCELAKDTTIDELLSEINACKEKSIDPSFYYKLLLENYPESYIGYFEFAKFLTGNFAPVFSETRHKKGEVIYKVSSDDKKNIEVIVNNEYYEVNFSIVEKLIKSAIALAKEDTFLLEDAIIYYNKIHKEIFRDNLEISIKPKIKKVSFFATKQFLFLCIFILVITIILINIIIFG